MSDIMLYYNNTMRWDFVCKIFLIVDYSEVNQKKKMHNFVNSSDVMTALWTVCKKHEIWLKFNQEHLMEY